MFRNLKEIKISSVGCIGNLQGVFELHDVRHELLDESSLLTLAD